MEPSNQFRTIRTLSVTSSIVIAIIIGVPSSISDLFTMFEWLN